MSIFTKTFSIVCFLILSVSVSKATTSAKGIIYIPVNMSDEATVIRLPKDRVIFVPVIYTSWFSTGSWPYGAITTPYYGWTGLPDYVEKENLNCLSKSGLKINVNLELIKVGESRDVVTIDVRKCEEIKAKYLVGLAFESIRLTATDEKQQRKRPRFSIVGNKKDAEKWAKLTIVFNKHDFSKPYDRKADFKSFVEEVIKKGQ